MAKLTGKKPTEYLPAKSVSVGGTYIAQNGRAYKVDSIRGHTVECRLVRKSGSGLSKYSHKGVYGHSIFFVDQLDAPPPPTTQVEEPPALGPWTQSGRLFSKHGTEMFYLQKRDDMSPSEADALSRKLVVALNLMDLG